MVYLVNGQGEVVSIGEVFRLLGGPPAGEVVEGAAVSVADEEAGQVLVAVEEEAERLAVERAEADLG
ncbi:hypothetical protein AB0C27_20545 [Nonomuraea sp. NPDC048882]|uniref:hypothetical protein n=1 Tax=Nonomuraea sp. NPDC048882 TaxID=3154347 RepID=UPI0033E02E5D